MTCPDAGTYYQHLGDLTSAQYYVNNKNVPVTSACQWNTDGSNEGNFAPVVIGAETDSSGATWLSIMTSRQNDPINYQELDYSIELVGDFGGSACFYTQSEGVGYYCSSGSLANFDPNQEGCKTFDPSAGVTVPGCTVSSWPCLQYLIASNVFIRSSSSLVPPRTIWSRPLENKGLVPYKHVCRTVYLYK